MLIVFVFLFLSNIYAYQTSVTADGNQLYWPHPNISIAIKNSTQDLEDASEIIGESINQFNVSKTKTPINITIQSNSPNEIRFENNFPFGSAVVGLTEITYNPTGVINNAVIRLNDKDYNFVSNSIVSNGNHASLGDVVTHELGHFLGLSHSEVLNSTMFYTTFKNQYTLSLDDKSGLIHKYGTTDPSKIGVIKGYVKGGNQIGILGVHVQIIQRNSGDVVGVITQEDGYFEAKGLDLNKAYYIYTSPTKFPESLPMFLADLQSRFCPGSYTGSFFSVCGKESEGYPQEIILTDAQKTVNVGVVTINCGLKVSEAYLEKKIDPMLEDIELISNTENDFSGRAFVGYFPESLLDTQETTESFKLNLTGISSPSSKTLKVNVLGYPFGSRLLFTSMKLKMVGGPEEKINNPGNNLALSLKLDSNHSLNNYTLEISAKKILEADLFNNFPSYELFSSETNMPYLILIELSSPSSNSISTISDNESCLDGPFTFKVDNAEIPSLEQSNEELMQNGSACGTIDNNGSGGNSGSNLLITCCGILFMQILFSLAKKAKIFLS